MEHTINHLHCPACLLVATMETQPIAVLPFPKASTLFQEIKFQQVCERTLKDYKDMERSLIRFFRELEILDDPISQLHIGHLRAYQQWRMKASPTHKAAGPGRVNHELSYLSMILQEADLWPKISPHYKPVRMPRPTVGVAITPEDEKRLFLIARTRKRWQVAYCCALLTVNTTAGPGEIRHLRLGDIDLGCRFIFVREGTKNEMRVREVPLNDTALWAVEQLLHRAKEKGSVLMQHYLLPHQRKGPTAPMLNWHVAWVHLREAAGLPTLRHYDLRHTAITKLLENPQVSERTVIDIAGHVSNHMLKRYSHIRRKMKEEAVAALQSSR